MDKRIQFQIQNLKSKLATYQSRLTDLKNQRDSNSQYHENRKTNPDHLILEDRKNLLIQENNNIRSQIHNLKHEIALLNNNLANYPKEFNRQLQDETTIYKDELENIKNLIQENEAQYQADLNTAALDKQTLADQIEQLKTEVVNQQDKIQNIQSVEHQSRKDTLAALHQKKRDKLAIQQKINQIYYTTNTFYQEHLNNISQNITNLQSLKTHIINQFYSGCPIKIDTPIPESHLTGIHLELLTPEYIATHGINPIIENIDTILGNLQSQHNMIINKAEKAKTNGQIQLDSLIQNQCQNQMQSNASRCKDKARLKSGFKGIYKMEKMRKMEMDHNLEQLIHIYSNYNELIISEIEKKYISQNEYFQTCLDNASQRLEIMTKRINTDQTTSTNNTNRNIINTKTAIELLSGNYMANNREISQIDNEIADYNKNRTILEDLNNQIEKIENIIKQTNADVEEMESLCN
jgi:chromosome segregation ATPase